MKNKFTSLSVTQVCSSTFAVGPLGILLFISLSWSLPANAYFDPGSGSAIIGVITATFGALWYSAKSVFYRLTGKNDANQSTAGDNNSLVIFSEGKAYWDTFRPVVEELIKQGIPFRYRTLDLHDPGLTVESSLMHAKRLSFNAFGLAELSRIEAPIMIATTPNIGTPGYPLPRPARVNNLVHLFHHVGDIATYKKHSLDHYDTVILGGEFQRQSIRDIEQCRGLKAKSLKALGLPYLDVLYQNRADATSLPSTTTTILVGSSWGDKGCLRRYGTDFIKALSRAGYSVIIRPHPQSYKSEPEYIELCKQQTSGLPLVRWDEAISPNQAMQEAQLLISDTSSLRFDFAFLYEKPIITLDIPKKDLVNFEAEDLAVHWHDSASDRIGKTLTLENISRLPVMVEQLLASDSGSDIQTFREQTLSNFGASAPKIVSYINAL